jgi:hypothetical protein
MAAGGNEGEYVGDGIWQDRHGNFFVGSYSYTGEHQDNPQPTTPRPVNVRQALEHFLEHDERSIDGEGSIAPVIRAMLKEGGPQKPTSVGCITPEKAILAIGLNTDGEASVTVPLSISMTWSGWFDLLLAARAEGKDIEILASQCLQYGRDTINIINGDDKPIEAKRGKAAR